MTPLQRLHGASAVLLDFDGPVCALFARGAAATAAKELRGALGQAGADVVHPAWHTDDPLQLLSVTANLAPNLVEYAERTLTDLEVRAAQVAVPTDGALAFVHHWSGPERRLALVSNNSSAAVVLALERFELARFVSLVSARDFGDATLLKPSPYLLKRAMSAFAVPSSASVFVGDSVTDVEAGLAAGVVTIGLANKAGKRERLARAGAVDVVDAMIDLVP